MNDTIIFNGNYINFSVLLFLQIDTEQDKLTQTYFVKHFVKHVTDLDDVSGRLAKPIHVVD